MKKLLIIFMIALFSTATLADIKVGIILGFTGPIESMTPFMAKAAELAFNEASKSKILLGGETITVIKEDSTCINPKIAVENALKLDANKVSAIVGADCSGVTGAIIKNVVLKERVPMISPSATSPMLSSLDNNGLFYRTAPSDFRAGELLVKIMKEKGFKKVAMTYTNNDYGKGYANAIEHFAKKNGLIITAVVKHTDGDKSNAKKVEKKLKQAGGEALVVVGYVDKTASDVIAEVLGSGSFKSFVLSDGMISDSLFKRFGNKLNGSIGLMPGSLGKGFQKFEKIAKASDLKPKMPFAAQSYDAAALIVLAMQAGKSTDRLHIAKNILSVANSPGKKIYPGQLKKALKLLAKGKSINYEGATDVEFLSNGDALGSYLEKVIKNKKFVTVKQR